MSDQHVEAGDEWAHLSLGRPRSSDDKNRAPTDSYLLGVTGLWVLKSVMAGSACPKVIYSPWWAHGSSCSRLIGREGVALDQ